MPLDPHVSRFLALLGASGRSRVRDASVDARRMGLAQLMKFGGPALPVGDLRDTAVPGPGGPIPVRLYTPLEASYASRLPAGLIYLHGGGLVAGSLDTHDGIARALAHAAGCTVVSVGYRLAPEHPFPAAVDDALAAVLHIAGHGGDFGMDGTRVGLCGDSAGATLAAVTCQTLARTAELRLSLQLLLCPILDHNDPVMPESDFGNGDLLDQATLDHDRKHYLPAGTEAADPKVSPLSAAAFAGLPPTIIHTAEFDPVRNDGKKYYERLRDSGSAATYHCHPGMIHLFYGLGGVIPHARRTFEQIGGQIRSILS